MSAPLRLVPGPLAWAPGAGGLLLPLGGEALLCQPAEDAEEVRELHLTLLRSADMAPLVAPLGAAGPALLAALPQWDLVWVSPRLLQVERPPHPVRDLPDERRPLRSWVQAVIDPAPHLARRAALIAQLDAWSRASGGPGFCPPPDGRTLHVTRFNNRGGDPRRSVGDIGPDDLGPDDLGADDPGPADLSPPPPARGR